MVWSSNLRGANELTLFFLRRLAGTVETLHPLNNGVSNDVFVVANRAASRLRYPWCIRWWGSLRVSLFRGDDTPQQRFRMGPRGFALGRYGRRAGSRGDIRPEVPKLHPESIKNKRTIPPISQRPMWGGICAREAMQIVRNFGTSGRGIMTGDAILRQFSFRTGRRSYGGVPSRI